jgi:hypothetical protein
MEEKYKKYAKAYFTDAASYGKRIDTENLIIKSGKLPENRLGQCVLGEERSMEGITATSKVIKTVTISTDYWDRFKEIGKYTLIYHELDHCVRNADHDDSGVLIEGNEIEKIMSTYSYLVSSTYYQRIYAKYWDGLVENMFTGKAQVWFSYQTYLDKKTALPSSVWATETYESMTR